jgi:hypothetical protein
VIGLTAVGPGCVLQIEETEVAATATGWTEETHLEVAASPGCPWVELAIPAGASLESLSGRTRLGDGSGSKLGEGRFEHRVRDRGGAGAIVVHLPELIQGDRATLDIVRAWSGGWIWPAGADGAIYASIRGPSDERVGLAPDPHTADTWWASPPSADAKARFGAPIEAEVPAAPATPPVTARNLALQVPPGANPQYTLFPGGGATTRVDASWAFQAEDVVRAVVVPLPASRDVASVIEPKGAAELVRRDDSILIVVAPSEGPARVGLSWVEPDAPTFGEGDDSLSVSCPGGAIRWEEKGDRRTWWLAAVGDTPILPDRSSLERALAHRFDAASIPEPGIPNDLRGRRVDWSLAEDALALLRQRYGVASFAADPLWPRKLVKARRSGALAPMEAALMLVDWLRQARIPAEWLLVRPQSRGPGWSISPAGYTWPVVEATIGGETRWIDVGCGGCAPFEVRPDAAGAALGGDGSSPPAPRGALHAIVDSTTSEWALSGAAALELRTWLATVPQQDREAALIARFAPGGALVTADGVGTAGAPIRVSFAGGTPIDPVPAGSMWPWIGEISLDRPTAAPDGAIAHQAGGLSWSRTITGGRDTERVETDNRSVDPAEMDSWRREAVAAVPL